MNYPELVQSRRAMIGAAILLFALGLVLYLPSFGAPFNFDDLQSIAQNHYIRAVNLTPASLYRAAFQDFKQNRPLSNLSFALNYYFNQANPFGYHLVNFCLFMLTGIGIWLLLRKLLNRLGFDRWRIELASWLSAMVWIAHPLNTQAVSYIVQRHTSMAGMFSVWSIYFYHLSQERGKWRRLAYGLCVCACLSALLCKESAFSLPAIIFAYKIYFFDELKSGWIRRNWKPILALAVFYFGAACFILRPSMRPVVFDFSRAPFTAFQRLVTEPAVLIWYAPLILFPIPQRLSLEHLFPVSHSVLEPGYTLFFIAVIISAVILAGYRARKNRLISFAVLWYFGQLVIEAMPLPIDLAAEHRLYLASLGLIVPGIGWLILRPEKIKALAGLIVLAGLFLASFTWQRNQLWRNQELLWRDAVKKSPQFFRPANNYCSILSELDKCQEAIHACKMSLSLGPNPESYNNLAVCYAKMGRDDLAEKSLRAAAALGKESAVAFYNLGMTRVIKHDYQGSLKWFLIAVEKDPFYADAHFQLAHAYVNLGRRDDYMRELQETIKLRPELIAARAELAWALVGAGKCDEAVELVKSAPAQDPQLSNILEHCRSR